MWCLMAMEHMTAKLLSRTLLPRKATRALTKVKLIADAMPDGMQLGHHATLPRRNVPFREAGKVHSFWCLMACRWSTTRPACPA